MNEIETLRKLGLTEYESQIILVLLHLGASKVGAIAKKCTVPKNKIYESLENLSKKGIVQIIPSSPKKYFIKNINSLNLLVKQKEEDLKQLKQNFKELELIKADKTIQSVNEPVSIIYGHEAFLAKLKESTEKLQKESLVVAKKVRADPVLLRLTRQAIKRGVKIRMLFPKIDLDKVKEWSDIGVKIRFLKEKPEMPFSIFDDKLCRLNVNITDNLSDPTLWIENKAFINILKEKFNSLWKESV